MQEQCKLIPDHQAWKIRSQMDGRSRAPGAHGCNEEGGANRCRKPGAATYKLNGRAKTNDQHAASNLQFQDHENPMRFQNGNIAIEKRIADHISQLAGDTESILYSLNSAMPTPWSNIFSCGGRAWKTCLWLSRQTTIFPIFRFQMQLQENACSTLASINIPSWNPLRPKILHRQKGPAASDNVLPLRDKAWAAGWATRTLQESATVEVLVLTLGTCRPKWMAKTGQSGMQNCEKGHTLWK